MRRNRRFTLFALLLTAAAGANVTASQTAGVHRVMRDKLTHSQRLLEAVVTSNWAMLGTDSDALARLTHDPRWMVFDAPEFVRDSEAFRRAVRGLRTAAGDRDLEAAAKAYSDVTLRCIDCHRNLARMRIAR